MKWKCFYERTPNLFNSNFKMSSIGLFINTYEEEQTIILVSFISLWILVLTAELGTIKFISICQVFFGKFASLKVKTMIQCVMESIFEIPLGYLN
jgi:hypothetical protein